MTRIDFFDIVRRAWQDYDASRQIKTIEDISVRVSTNHVYKIRFSDNSIIIAKLSYFGNYEHFVEDHSIINSLSNNLPEPFDHFLSRSLMKGNSLYVYRYKKYPLDVWVIFYRPIGVAHKLPSKLDQHHIKALAKEFARFHRACTVVKNTLPTSSKSSRSDIEDLAAYLETEEGYYEHGMAKEQIEHHCKKYFEFYDHPESQKIATIPVFVDWNIGNFSVTEDLKLYSRWDYDWFRMSSRMIDFYFFSRIVSDIGDKTVFTYNIDVLEEDNFILFLKYYHKEFPLTAFEIDMLPEMYRFFLLNYVVKFGRYFFHESYATKLRAEVFQTHFPSIANFSTVKIKKALKL